MTDGTLDAAIDEIRELKAEVARLREALEQIGCAVPPSELKVKDDGGFAKYKATTNSLPSPASSATPCTCHSDYWERDLIDPACGVVNPMSHARDQIHPTQKPKRPKRVS